jgi:exodeoxyribonuclease VII small subunit
MTDEQALFLAPDADAVGGGGSEPGGSEPGGSGPVGSEPGGSELSGGDILGGLSFKQASDELEAIVRRLEGNQLELEEALTQYQRGASLIKGLQARLAAAQQQVAVMMGELELDASMESMDGIDTSLS